VTAEQFLAGRAIDIAGVHGQTVAHGAAYTLQLGSGAQLAQRLSAPVITGFREADIAAGGNGAPLMPFLDWMLLRGDNRCQATLNIGGIANIAIVPGDGKRTDVIGYDTGPGMSLIDNGAQLWFNDGIDRDAGYSRDGQLRSELLAWLMNHPYIKAEPPKSTGRDIFGRDLLVELRTRFDLPEQDIMRTLVSFTAKSIAYNLAQSIKLSGPVNSLFVSGGGLKHPLLMSELQQALPEMEISSSKDLGVDPDIKEALLMAVLAVAHMQNMAGNMTGVTGAIRAVVLGHQTG
jgi:anhydro-N-acetylmuramic acid kinase